MCDQQTSSTGIIIKHNNIVDISVECAFARVGVRMRARARRTHLYTRATCTYVMTTQYRRGDQQRRGCPFSRSPDRFENALLTPATLGSMITRINSRMDELCSRSALSLSSQREKEMNDRRRILIGEREGQVQPRRIERENYEICLSSNRHI